MKYVTFLKGNFNSYRTMYGYSQQFDAYMYKGRHGFVWYNPTNCNEHVIAIQFVKNDACVFDVLYDEELNLNVQCVNSMPIVCHVINEDYVKNRVKKILEFIYDLDINRTLQI